jgi:hypothetical protein
MRNDSKDLEKGLQEVWNKNPQLKSKSPSVLGADILTDKKGKNWAVEINDQSGFFHPGYNASGTFMSHKLYKHITGRDTRVVSALKGTAVAGATAIGLNTIKNKERG